MRRCSALASFSLPWFLTLVGCAVCENCDERAYSGYGGKWHRTDRYHGRVGSLFEPAGAPIDEVITESSIIESAEPTPADVTWSDEAGIELTPAVPTPTPY